MTLRKYPYKKRCVSQQQTKPFARAKDAKKETTLCVPLASIKVSFFWTDLSTKALALVRLQELSVHHVCGSYHGVHWLVIKRGRRNHQRYRTERKITGDWGEATVYTCHIWESENRMYKYLTPLVTSNNTINLNGKFLDGLSFTERLKKLRIGFEKYFGRRIPVMNLSLFTAWSN